MRLEVCGSLPLIDLCTSLLFFFMFLRTKQLMSIIIIYVTQALFNVIDPFLLFHLYRYWDAKPT